MMPRALLNTFRRTAILLLLLQLCVSGVSADKAFDHSHSSHAHQHVHPRAHSHNSHGDNLRRGVAREPVNAPAPSKPDSSTSLQEAKDTVNRALKALAIANKLRLDHPQYNKYEFRNASEIAHGFKIAPPLSYGLSNNSSNAPSSKRLSRSLPANTSTTATSNASYAYSIPNELANAARIVAEAEAVGNSGLNLAVQSSPLPGTNDTNSMAQALLQPDGLHGYVPNVTVATIVSKNAPDATLSKRDTSTFWMENMKHNEVSPFAPPGYKVWRNVKDYGATGDVLKKYCQCLSTDLLYR